MELFQSIHPTEPDAAAKYRIRDRKSWTEVFDPLEAAKVKYYQTKGFKGGVRKIHRKSGDNVQPLIGVTKALPDIDMVTPVLGVVQVLVTEHQITSSRLPSTPPRFARPCLGHSTALSPCFHRSSSQDIPRRRKHQTGIYRTDSRDFACGRPPESGTTHFCTKLIEHIAEHPRHLSLNFFCGQHLEPCNPHSGGRAMIQTFLCQLLNQCDFGPQYQVNQELELIRAGDVKELYRMFESLFRRADPSLCVFCIIDGVVFYERDEFLQDLGDVVLMIVKLSAEHDTHMPILKVLIASPTKTSVVRRLFTDDQIFSMTTMSEYIEDPSPMRVERRLKEEESGSSFGL
ncbi:hypothetical protein MCOR31_011208 [Pyricularia oryzae]|nr:hypothetical protein MCOR31_011208 [Pyricularia oryzae]KAI6472759.1 hypothetical protein MCOR15_000325 [Pyricularia oryzae]KAI6541764.1 hypothetical protein MCOR16_000482 [Pyricularia oryzae]